MLFRSGLIDWSRAAREIVDLVRGVNPWPGAYTHLDGKPLKVWKAAAMTATIPSSAPGAVAGSPFPAPGTVLAASLHEGLLVACGSGEAVSLLNVQAEGKKPLPAAEFLRGHALAPGARLA